jgi:acetate kinase
MNIFVINAGTSNLKFQVIATDLDRIKRIPTSFCAEGWWNGSAEKRSLRSRLIEISGRS